jgi:two-component sensor histidine kinase
VQGLDRARRDVAQIRERLVADARLSAAPEQNVLAAAEHIGRVLASLPQVSNATDSCEDELASALKGISFISNASRIDRRGRVACSAHPAAGGLPAGNLSNWRALRSDADFQISGQSHSTVTGEPIVLVRLPLRDAAGQFDGALDMEIEARWFDDMIRRSRLPRGSVVALFDRSGAIIASNDPARAIRLFPRGSLIGNAETVHVASDRQGKNWIYAAAPLLAENVFVGFAVPEAGALRPTHIRVATDFSLPFAMLALSWLAIWIATERQVTRWIVYLRRIATAYRAGHYALRPKLAGASREFRVLGDSLSTMADSIQERDRSLREALAQKSLLIKEVHHRVKNNMQIVMSLLSLQAGRLRDPAAQDALRQARGRINALALVHRILYEIEDQQSVDIKPLLEQLADQTREGFGGERREIRSVVEAESLELPAESAVPVALFVVEALTNAFKHAFPLGRGGTVALCLHRLDSDTLKLAVKDDGIGLDESRLETSIGGRLISTFGQQLGGRAQIHSSGSGGTAVELIFPQPVATGEYPRPALPKADAAE